MDHSSSSESELEEVSSRSTTKYKVIHKMYSKGQKKAVAEYARFHGIHAASRHFGVHHKNVSIWRKNQLTKLLIPHEREKQKGQRRKISYPQELEDKFFAWLLEKREVDSVAVSTQVIRLKTVSLLNPSNKASDGWVRKFMKMNDLV